MVQRAKQRAGMKTHKKQKVAKVSPKQRKTIKTRAGKLYDFLGTEKWNLVMDDETYVKADFGMLSGAQYFTKTDEETLPESETTIGMEKFGKKYLIWQAIAQDGSRSQTIVTTETINKDIYMKECIKKRLLPFLGKLNPPTLFWPDLATSHYANDTINLLNEKNVCFVSKHMNPPNFPQCRLIER